MIDVKTLKRAVCKLGYTSTMGNQPNVWFGEAHGVEVQFETFDYDAEFWVSPIWTMREKGVALVDSHGTMVKNERRDR